VKSICHDDLFAFLEKAQEAVWLGLEGVNLIAFVIELCRVADSSKFPHSAKQQEEFILFRFGQIQKIL
jgi:hypothetical protein